PASVADSRHELAVAVETLHQVDHGRVPPHLVRGIATRDHHAIKIFSADVLGAHFGLGRVAVAASVCLPGRPAHNLAPCASHQHASGNIGATNILRTLGWRAALPVLLFDALKGAIGVLLLRLVGGGPEWQALGGIAAMAGHIWPFTLGFHGGRGVATGIGVLAALDPLAALVSALVFVLVVATSRFVSLGSITAGIPAVIVLVLRGASPGELAVGFV